MSSGSKYIDKKKNKIIVNSKEAEAFSNVTNSVVKEEVPVFLGRTTDLVIKPEHDSNALICLGRDRNSLQTKDFQDPKTGEMKKRMVENLTKDSTSVELGSGYGSHQGSGAIYFVVGRGAPYPVNPAPNGSSKPLVPLFRTVDDELGATGTKKLGINRDRNHPAVLMDAASIYMSQMTDIDDYFGLETADRRLALGDTNPCSAIIMKADRCRIHSRRDVRIIAGGDGTKFRDSNGNLIKQETAKIHLIVGNGKNYNKKNNLNKQQPAVLGDNLLIALKEILKMQQDTLKEMNRALVQQQKMNTILAATVELVPGVGTTISNPIKILAEIDSTLQTAIGFINQYIGSHFNSPMEKLGSCNPLSERYILSRNVTLN